MNSNNPKHHRTNLSDLTQLLPASDNQNNFDDSISGSDEETEWPNYDGASSDQTHDGESDDWDDDQYSLYERWYDPDWEEGSLPHPSKKSDKPKKDASDIVRELAEEAIGLEGGLDITYEPSPYETEWLTESMHPFFELEYITDILGQVKGGKEASVYRCVGHELTSCELLAAKVYRPRKFRNLSNDKMYREGRSILQADGGAAKANDDRLLRAIGKRTAYGAQASHTSWLMHEFNTLKFLHDEGAAVPKPIATSGNAILMEYIGSRVRGAPTLHEVSLDKDEAVEIFNEVLRNVDLMLQMGLVHGDLSAYNILYWEGKITLIDFPQVTDSEKNSNARFILNRDVERVCDYFRKQGIRCDAKALSRKLWDRYAYYNKEDRLATYSRWVEPLDDE